jgi:hypothetical protein
LRSLCIIAGPSAESLGCVFLMRAPASVLKSPTLADPGIQVNLEITQDGVCLVRIRV